MTYHILQKLVYFLPALYLATLKSHNQQEALTAQSQSINNKVKQIAMF